MIAAGVGATGACRGTTPDDQRSYGQACGQLRGSELGEPSWGMTLTTTVSHAGSPDERDPTPHPILQPTYLGPVQTR